MQALWYFSVVSMALTACAATSVPVSDPNAGLFVGAFVMSVLIAAVSGARGFR